MENKIENTILYKLASISTREFSYSNPFTSVNQATEKVLYDIRPSLKYNFEKGQILINVIVVAKLETTKEDFARISTNFIFEIDDIKKHFDVKGDKANVNKKSETFLLSLLGICVSMMRGLVVEKFAGTILQNKFLPIIDLRNFINSQKNSE